MFINRQLPCFSMLLTAMAVFLVTAGCGQQTSTREKGHKPASPREILSRLADTYSQAKTYQDAGELHVVAPGGAEDAPQPFAVAVERPNKARIHALGAIVVSNGEQFRAVAPSLDDQILVRPSTEGLSLNDFMSDELLAQAMRGQLDAGLPQLALLLDPQAIDDMTAGCTLEQLPMADFQGEACQRIAAKGPAGTAVFWISMESHLLRKYEFPMTVIREQFPLASVWIDLKGAQCNAPISRLAFQMEVPSAAKLVKHFVMPAPEAPTTLLSQAPGDFSFADMQGGQVTRESLGGKVVVLDLWATWCGWCFEGLPLLEKVYAKYKDDDRVAILAVCKDEVAVTDERVRSAFGQHKLTIPIVRDLSQATDQVFQVRALPTCILLGTDGTIQEYHVGYDPHLADNLPLKIEQLLAGEDLATKELEAYERERAAYEERLSEALIDRANETDPAEVAGRGTKRE
jgi:thiol-disulfide isomerase/thioredoxin/outer membrane lipoprotein-sorting protein